MYNKLPFWIHLEFKIESRFSPKPHNRTPLRKPPKTCIWVCTYCKTWIRWRFWETWPTYCVILNSTWIQLEFNLNSRFPKKLIIWPPSEYLWKRAFEFVLIVKVFQVGVFGQTGQLIVFSAGFLRSAEFKMNSSFQDEFKIQVETQKDNKSISWFRKRLFYKGFNNLL